MRTYIQTIPIMYNKFKIIAATVLALVFSAVSLHAQPILRLPSVIGEHMVLQAGSKVRIWGWADPKTNVKVFPGWACDTLTVQAGGDTKWSVEIETPSKGGPYSIYIGTPKKNITIEDVLIGEVWLCGGQSNMNWSARNGIRDMQEELKGDMNPQIRLFTVTKNSSPWPQEDCEGRWEVCTPESAQWFSATGYFFGKHLAAELDCPVGLIHSSWGGSPVETWTPAELFTSRPELAEQWKKVPKSQGWDISIGTTYNAMIHPIENIRIAGTIWYQGEGNVANAETYSEAFKLLIKGWRGRFGYDFPFYYVQIAPYSRYAKGRGILVREQQASVEKEIDGTGMVVISDLVDNIADVHPRYKEQVGRRLARMALAETYGLVVGNYRSPSYRSMEIKGRKAVISFDNAGGGLVCRGKEAADLEICGPDMVFVKASGKISRDGNTLIVTAKGITDPVAVRYAFRNEATGNIFSADGLPLAPFRTDDLIVTE